MSGPKSREVGEEDWEERRKGENPGKTKGSFIVRVGKEGGGGRSFPIRLPLEKDKERAWGKPYGEV